MNTAIFEKNLELWSYSCPKEAIQLQYVDCSRSLSFYRTIYSLEEAQVWQKTIDLGEIEVLYVYGVALGYQYEVLKEWLQENPQNQLVFLEDDPEVLVRFFELEVATRLLSDRQAHVYYFNEIDQAEAIFDRLFWDFPMAQWGVAAVGYYEKTKEAKYIALREQLSYDAAIKNALLKEYLDYGAIFFHNFYANMRQINKASLGNALFGQFENVPAIICGAGPSLQKNIDWLKKAKGNALLFAGSSALNALAAAGIQPDLGAGIDPNPMQEERLNKLPPGDFPFFYRNRICPGALQWVKGPKLYITGSGGYPISEFFESRWGIEAPWIEEGRNVVNFCLEIACEMGCNPIIFVGMDLAFTGDQSYSGGVIEDPSVLNVAPHEKIVVKQDIFGKEVKTLWKWVAEAKWMGDFAENHPEKTVLNATEGGIGFPGVENVSLESVVSSLGEKLGIEKRLKGCIAEASLARISDQNIQEVFQELKEGLMRCQQLLQVLIDENAKHAQTGEAMLAETELLEEPAFHAVLQIFNQVATKLMQRDLRELFDPKNPLSEVEREEEKCALNHQKYLFLQRVIQVNLGLLQEKGR